ncbi:MAG: carboxypeptidase regulatory-like domain-containing protein [bacterium]
MERKIFSIFGMLILGILLCSTLLWSQSTKIDFALSGKYEGGATYLKWNAPAGDSVKYFLVYRGQTSGILAFIRTDSTTTIESVDRPPVSVNPPIFVYYVVAVMKNGSMRYSNMVNINVTDVVRVTSKPAESASLNVQYTYQVVATTTDPAVTLSYQLSMKPEGMTIDPATGLLKWIPLQKGTFKVVVVVTSTRGGRAEQPFTVVVNGPTGTVAGSVTDPAGKSVKGATVYLYPKNSLLSIQFKGITDSLGNYTISKVDSGLYLVRATPNRSDLYEQWFDGVTNAELATPITVKPNAPVTVNFKLSVKNDVIAISSKPLESGVVGTLYSYQVKATSSDPTVLLSYQLTMKPEGMTIDAVTGLINWIPQSKGTFKASLLVTSSRGGRAEQMFGVTISGPTGSVTGIVTDSEGKPLTKVTIRLYQKNTIQYFEIRGITDSLGKYTIIRVDTGSYVARAIPYNSNYLEQWYDGVMSVEQATYFPVKTNTTTTVNFKLTAKGDIVRITSKAAESATLNIPYTYQVIATSTDPTATLTYQLSAKPNGMTIESATGLIKWVPDQKGIFKAALLVTSTKGGRADQSFSVAVQGPTGTVAGVVKDSLGKPLAGIYVRLYKKDAFQVLEIKGVTGSDGTYTITRVDSGTYVARATSSRGDYLEQWYDGAASSDKATLILVRPNATSTVNFIMKAKVVLPLYTVSGSVLDDTQKPMREATVVFTASGFSLNAGVSLMPGESGTVSTRDLFDSMNSQIPKPTDPLVSTIQINGDGRIDGTSEYVYKVRVDSTGKYSVKVPQGSYTAMATAPGYLNVFFDGKSDLLTANVIKLTKDTTKISFTLKKISSVSTGKISGTVVDSATKAGLRARVVAYLDPAVKTYTNLPLSYTTDTDSTGAYNFNNLPPGNYIIFALPLGHYTPTFYCISGPTTSWEKATRIPINGNSVAAITIIVKPLVKAMAGYTSIQGVVALSGGAARNSEAGTLAGVMVYALVNSEDVAGYGITDQSGNFTIQDLTPGSYTLIVDKVNYLSMGSVKANPAYHSSSDGAAQPATAFLTITPISVSEIGHEKMVPAGFVLEQNFPNPFNPSTTIRYSIPTDSKVTLEVFSLLGKNVATLVERMLKAGEYQIQFNAASLPSGTYFYSLTAGEFRLTRKLMLIR